MKKLNWLDKFAQEQATKVSKTASLNKKAEQAIVDADSVPGAQNGSVVEFMGEQYRVVDANFQDDKGAGVLLEKAAAYEGLESDPIGLAMGAPATSVAPQGAGQTYHRVDPGNVYQTYDNDQDAQWGSDSANSTVQEIAGENGVDRTTVPGHYTKSPGLGGGMVAPMGTPVDGTAPVAQPTVVQAGLEGVAPVAPQGTPVGVPAGMGGGNSNPQTPGNVQDNTRPEGEFGTQVANDLQQQVAFQPQPGLPTGAAPTISGTPVGATSNSAPAFAPTTAPVATPAAPVGGTAPVATPAPTDGVKAEDDIEIEEDGKDAGEDKKEDKVEDKMASNRILARILKAYKN